MPCPHPRRCCYLDEGEVAQLFAASDELRRLAREIEARGLRLRPVRRPRLVIGAPMRFRLRWRVPVDDGYLQEEVTISYTLSAAEEIGR